MINDYKDIKDVVMQYVNGCATGDVELTKKAFHKDAVMFGYLNSELSGGSIENLYAAINALGASPETKWEIDVMQVVGTAATVRVVLGNWHGVSFTDFHSLVKIDGKWTIVAKIFHQ
ncbi:MAG: nuclear transport factor 2 family protein [Muribaculaceae bacterium]|nr:nuclear transport factor 2 family protein [Muribaculaceae bacterium]